MPEEKELDTVVEPTEDDEEEIDYKALYEKSQADVEKWKSRFKSVKLKKKKKLNTLSMIATSIRKWKKSYSLKKTLQLVSLERK